MPSTGSIIQLHHHNNFELLEFLTEDAGNLYYKDKPIYTPISSVPNNALEQKEDGLYVWGETIPTLGEHDILSRFSFENANLYFDNIIVSREYERQAIQLMVVQLWDTINSGGTV